MVGWTLSWSDTPTWSMASLRKKLSYYSQRSLMLLLDGQFSTIAQPESPVTLYKITFSLQDCSDEAGHFGHIAGD